MSSLLSRLPQPAKEAIKRRVWPELMPEGADVPEWQLQSWDGSWHRHGRTNWSILVFYASDGDPQAQAQLLDLQAQRPRLSELGAKVYGFNPAEADSHRRFAESSGIALPLLTDRGASVARQFKAAMQTPFKTFLIPTVYLVNPERKVRLANRGHPSAAAIVRSIEALQQATRKGM